ncbi:SDR family NAD(P)-dependent oxidoreductase [Dermatobacter hominis]|uniref:SDR family NAD(P)-dependent oxidoreductase n=1 Tax=Dermatobacter hominis TaxID=2884263 RepID=UPI001D1138C8|nr:SDR family NAD(P)-dependent oxidoreductase [Dermatobacter hominis]UDY38031.1 SDR family oxidoreductase [Dermatobacter hominis]
MLAGRTAVITGGASGMGRAASVLFAENGAHVVVVDRDGPAGAEVVDEIRAAGGSAEHHVLDLSDQGAVAPWSEALEHEVVDVLFSHAGLPGPPGWRFDADSWNETMVVNVWAPMEVTRQLLPRLRRAPSASLIYTASTSGIRAVPGLLTYSASKGALIQFVRSLAVQLAPEGIRANAICPGATDTPALRRDIEDGTVTASIETIAQHIPMRRLGTVDDVAGVALFLASDASAYVTGQAIPIDGGATA